MIRDRLRDMLPGGDGDWEERLATITSETLELEAVPPLSSRDELRHFLSSLETVLDDLEPRLRAVAQPSVEHLAGEEHIGDLPEAVSLLSLATQLRDEALPQVHTNLEALDQALAKSSNLLRQRVNQELSSIKQQMSAYHADRDRLASLQNMREQLIEQEQGLADPSAVALLLEERSQIEAEIEQLSSSRLPEVSPEDLQQVQNAVLAGLFSENEHLSEVAHELISSYRKARETYRSIMHRIHSPGSGVEAGLELWKLIPGEADPSLIRQISLSEVIAQERAFKNFESDLEAIRRMRD